MRIDVGRLRELEWRADKEFDALAEGVRKGLEGTGADIAERHMISGQRNARIARKAAEGVMAHQPEAMGELNCICLFFNSAAASSHGSDPETITPAGAPPRRKCVSMQRAASLTRW
ncbi:hypothetical protein SAMN05444722_0668 [Rhodovulum sp. ES.010]|uniref:hypothetical protein n=1 Tax=Rhodovulum sp. ES.010 TaxID=1882821 RepID=UPI00092ABC34|nr:hypothetical protein [Rhodovulum sp. ES.010]SIO16443.1 hypothetical protein SAMN05444722_0668 [Rhodovulum sp. ES.010]